MSARPQAQPAPTGGTLRVTLTVPKIVFLVIAAASPLAAMVGMLPLAFAHGAGPQTPLMYVVVGGVLLLFAVGYAAMSRQFTSAGGLYTYVARGLGRRAGVAAAYIALLSYNAFGVMLVAAFAFYSHLILGEVGLDVPWQVYAGLAIVLVALLGVRNIGVSAKVLMVLITAELAILLAVDIAFIAQTGLGSFPLAAFDPTALDGRALSVGLMFAVASFLGFEAAALYGEESVNPTRTVPRATYASVLVIALFYGFTTWVSVGAAGVATVQADALAQGGDFFINLTTAKAGETIAALLALLLLTSLFATLLACHNATNRIAFALGREGVLPRKFATIGATREVPYLGSLVQTVLYILVIGSFALSGRDPYTELTVWMTGLGTLGLVLLQGLTSLAVIAWFRRDPERQRWQTQLAPALAAVGLFTGAALIVAHYSELTEAPPGPSGYGPLAFVVLALAGWGHATWLRRHRPEVYARIGMPAPDRDSATVNHVDRLATDERTPA